VNRKFERAYGVLQADKTAVSEECKTLILRELEGKLREYFELSSPLALDVVQTRGEYEISLSFTAERVKCFQVLK